jgi:hypothetical protein
MTNYLALERAEYVRDLYADIHNELKSLRFRMHALAVDAAQTEDRIERLLVELLDSLDSERSPGAPLLAPGEPKLPY